MVHCLNSPLSLHKVLEDTTIYNKTQQIHIYDDTTTKTTLKTSGTTTCFKFTECRVYTVLIQRTNRWKNINLIWQKYMSQVLIHSLFRMKNSL